jgi:hypothetical protein
MCVVENCNEKVHGHGMCRHHYNSWKTHGDPLASKEHYGPLLERFFRYAKKGVSEDDCWEWTAAKNPQGYGKISIGAPSHKVEGAHRVSWILHNNLEIPAGLFVLHSCDNPECTNPKHLRVGTKADNMKDMYSRARQGKRNLPIGEKNKKAVLTVEKVLQIRSSTKTNGQLAEEMGISKTCVRLARIGETWSHVPFL